MKEKEKEMKDEKEAERQVSAFPCVVRGFVLSNTTSSDASKRSKTGERPRRRSSDMK